MQGCICQLMAVEPSGKGNARECKLIGTEVMLGYKVMSKLIFKRYRLIRL